MIKLSKILFLNSLFISTLITISSYSWMNMWIGLELNLLSIIPLMNSNTNKYSSEAAMKYFLTQVMASMILLFSMILIMLNNEFLSIYYSPMMNILFNLALFIKMGTAPVHFWFPEIMEGLNWMNCLIMLTWQKIAPMIMIIYNCNLYILFFWIIIFSLLIGSIMGLNQSSLRKILTYSSINHMGWMISMILINQTMWLIYLLIYSFINLNLIWIFNKFNIFYIFQMNSMFNNSMIKLFFNVNFLSLGGLPPFLGFFPKWMTLNFLINQNQFILISIMIFSSLITLYFYIRLMFSSLTFSIYKTNTYQIKLNCFLIYFLNFFSISSFPLMTLLFNWT